MSEFYPIVGEITLFYNSYGTVELPAGAFLGPILEVCTRFDPLIREHVLSEFIGQHDVLVFLVHF